jgi:2,3-bisphosphoglycerate-dependent phosphoglycerate mutase
MIKMAYLVLVRHGLSEFNKKGLWTGWTDVPLVEEGFEQARKTGKELSSIKFDFAYSADLIRATQTLEEIEKEIGQNLPIIKDAALRERNYGIYTKKNKWQIKEEVGEEVFQKIRRSWDYPIENGENLKQVYERIVPYFEREIIPKLKSGKNVIATTSGNPFRALVKYFENIPDDKIGDLEVGTGEAYVYRIDSAGKVISKEIRGENPMKGKV